MAYNGVDLAIDPLYLQPKSYDARADRKWFADLISAGVVSAGDFNVTYSGGTLVLNVAPGVAYILGGNIADQGMYRQYVSAQVQVTCPAADGSNPRIDTVILRVFDNAADASTLNKTRAEVVPGTATAGATLANLNGKANLAAMTDASQSYIILAYILVPTAAVVLTNTATNVLDVRKLARVGSGVAGGGGPLIGQTIEWNSTTLPPTTEGTYIVEDGSAISRTTYATCFARMGTGAGAGDGSTTFNIADHRGRATMGYAPSGGHTDSSTMFGTEGVAVANRRMRHRHTPHRHTFPYFSPGVDSNGVNAISLDNVVFGTNSTLIATTDGGSGVGTDPLDGPAYIVKNKILRIA